MITKRIIPCLDIDQGRVVKGVNFVDIKDAGDPVELAKKYADEGADELVFLDITASSDKRVILKNLVKRIAKELFIPFTVGGGIDSISMIQEMLNLGADKVSLNTAALQNPSLIQEASHHFGAQCIVVAVDIKRRHLGTSVAFLGDEALESLASGQDTLFEVYSHGGRKNLGIDALKWIRFCEDLGAGELLITSMDRDGTKDGYDIDLLSRIKNSASLPVIASGGAGSIKDIASALKVSDAALIASLLHYGIFTVDEIKTGLISDGVTVR